MIWPMLETMPDPLTPSDRAYLDKTAKVMDMLHGEFGMRVWLALCPNVKHQTDREAARQRPRGGTSSTAIRGSTPPIRPRCVR